MQGIQFGHDPLRVAEEWKRQGRQVALATVIATWGSAPRPVGSHLVVDESGNFEGSVSGGCVEAAVVFEAQEVLVDGRPRVVDFGVADETAWRAGLSCGGRISIYVERIDG
ncbi:XdhC family protein [Rhizobium laguerreae]|uniref:XdhC family protein n=1 Tax=Rhizobium laguerreae TaxID=1076926 RepID=UPI001C92AD28|nr:XdhC family protein [Rhizobium laguerreae]MBY3418347.1 XdhC family protein [Rhizobium laguerreae]